MKRLALTIAGASILAFMVWAIVYTCYHPTPPPQSQSEVSVYYIKLAAIYDGDLDTARPATIAKEVLEQAAPSFVNVPILLNHDHRDVGSCIGRTVSSKVVFDAQRKQYYLEVVAKISDAAAIAKIKSGLYYSVSVGIGVLDSTCSVDGLDPLDCKHRAGEWYKINGKWMLARVTIKRVVGLEISFVNVPGSNGARILDFSPSMQSLGTSK
jgi:hypothetical protein